MRTILLALLCAAGAWPQCGTLVINPITHKQDCIGSGGGSGTVTTTGTMTSGAIVTSNGTTVIKTPSATATIDGSGNANFPGTVTIGATLPGGAPANSLAIGGNFYGLALALTGSTTGYIDMKIGTSPGNPAAGNCRLYTDSGTGVVTALTSAGASCMPTLSIPGTVVQTNQSNVYSTGTQDFTSAAHVLAKNGLAASKPGTCTVGEFYFATDATAGQNWYLCTATNTWTQQTGGGAATSALKLVDSGANDAVLVTADSGTIVDQVTVQNSNTSNHLVKLSATGSDSNISMELSPKGSGTVIVPVAGMTSGASAPAAFSVGTCATGNNFGVAACITPLSTTGSAEILRLGKPDGTWAGSNFAGTWYVSGKVETGSTGSGNAGTATMDSAGIFSVRSVGYFAASSGGTGGSSLDTGLARNAAGVWEINSAASGGTAAANIRDLKLRHAIWSGTAPTIASGFGSSPSVAGADSAGRLTVGSGGSAATGAITFGTTWATAPACVANNETTIQLVQATATTTTLTLTASAAFTAADKLTWICQGY